MLDTLPTEVLYKVLSHLGVADLVRLERVSRHLSDVTIHRAVWADAYRFTTLARPPGPYTWQTTSHLKSALVRTARVELNWPPTSQTRLSRRSLGFLPGRLGIWPDPCLLFGRWVLARTEIGVICFDVDARIPYECWLLEAPSGSTFEHLNCVSHTCAEGRYAYALVEEKEDVSGDTTARVFKIELSEDFPPKLLSLIDLPAPQSMQTRLVIGPKTLVISLGYVDGDDYFHPYDGIWVMDIATEKFYRLQPPERKGGFPEWVFSQIHVGLTHFVIILYRLFGSTELVEAFELPHRLNQDVMDASYPRVLQPSYRSQLPPGLYLATSILKARDPLRGSIWSNALTFPAWLHDDSLIVSACDADGVHLAEDVDLVRISFRDSPSDDKPAPIHFRQGCFSGLQSLLPGARASYFSDDTTSDAEEARFLVEGVPPSVGVDEAELFGLTVAFSQADDESFPRLRKITVPSRPFILHAPESIACFDGARGMLVVVRRMREGSVLQIIDLALAAELWGHHESRTQRNNRLAQPNTHR